MHKNPQTARPLWIRLTVSSASVLQVMLSISFWSLPYFCTAFRLQFNPKHLVKRNHFLWIKKKRRSHGFCLPSQYFQITNSWDRNLEQGVSTTQFRRKSNDKKNNPRLHNNKGLNLNVSLYFGCLNMLTRGDEPSGINISMQTQIFHWGNGCSGGPQHRLVFEKGSNSCSALNSSGDETHQ